ncbi:MAG: hypothetical protein NVS9B15_22950 [Acidobacteriaceae bacterium]
MGMRPYILTPREGGAASLFLQREVSESPDSPSLLTAWNEVRHWRRSFDELGSEYDLIHAHCFAAGMAAARSSTLFVYDLVAFFEQLAAVQGASRDGSWMGRSFRVAEHFILTRASAIVVHTSALKEECCKRGVAAESVFVIPEHLGIEGPLAREVGADRSRIVAPDAGVLSTHMDARAELLLLMSAFASAAKSDQRFLLCMNPDEPLRALVLNRASELSVRDQVALVDIDPETRSDLVIASNISRTQRHLAFAEMTASDTVIRAMRRGCAVLATDSPSTRNASQDGDGVLWHSGKSASELAERICYLAREPEFTRALGEAGRDYIERTHSIVAVGAAYDQLYRYAQQKHNSRRPSPPNSARLMPAYGSA